VSEFCPDGYVSMSEAILRLAQRWFGEEMAAFNKAVEDDASKPDSSSPALVEFAQQTVAKEIFRKTVDKLRKLMHQGKPTAYYFGSPFDRDRHPVEANSWATADANGVLEEGWYWPFGRQVRYPVRLFLLEAELDALLSDHPARKRRFPDVKYPDLVATLRKLDLPRKKQRATVRSMPEFEPYNITELVFRRAFRLAGQRGPGRKRQRD
jgi:hypothetical protein